MRSAAYRQARGHLRGARHTGVASAPDDAEPLWGSPVAEFPRTPLSRHDRVVSRVVLDGREPARDRHRGGLLDRDATSPCCDRRTLARPGVTPVDCGFRPRTRSAPRSRPPKHALGGVDQVVHTWLAPSIVTPHVFTDLDEAAWVDGCERSMEAAWWLARRAWSPRSPRRTGRSCVVVPTIGMSGGANFSMLAATAEAMRVLDEGLRPAVGLVGITANTLAAAPNHWVTDDEADALTRSVSLSVPAFGTAGRSRGTIWRRSIADARRPRRALPHRRHPGGRRRDLDGAVSGLLERKTVVVTGAGGGIGEGIALACAGRRCQRGRRGAPHARPVTRSPPRSSGAAGVRSRCVVT